MDYSLCFQRNFANMNKAKKCENDAKFRENAKISWKCFCENHKCCGVSISVVITPRDVDVFIFVFFLNIVSLWKRWRKIEKETIVYKNDRFFKNGRFYNDRFYKLFVSLTIVKGDPSLRIVNAEPSLTIVNEDRKPTWRASELIIE